MPSVVRYRRRRARCVPYRPVYAFNPRSLTDTFTRLLTCASDSSQHRRLRPPKQLIMLLRLFRSSDNVAVRMNRIVNSPDALGDDPCTVTGIRAINEPGEGLVEMEITVRCSLRARGRTTRASTPRSGSSIIWCVSAGTRARWGSTHTGGSGSTSRKVNSKTSPALSGKQRGTPTPSTRLPWPATANTPSSSRRPCARRSPTLPSVPACQKISPASTPYCPRPNSSSCCRAASRPRSRVLSAVRVGLPPDDLG